MKPKKKSAVIINILFYKRPIYVASHKKHEIEHPLGLGFPEQIAGQTFFLPTEDDQQPHESNKFSGHSGERRMISSS